MFFTKPFYKEIYKVEVMKNNNFVKEVIDLKESNYQLGRQIEEYKKSIDDLKTDKQLLIDKNFNLTCRIRELEQEIDKLKHPTRVKCCRRICCKGV